MNAFLRFVKTTLLGGLLLLLPAVVIAVLARKLFDFLFNLLEPVEELLPRATIVGIKAPYFVAFMAVLLVCFIAGLIARTAIGGKLSSTLERAILGKLPGYTILRSMLSGTLPTGTPVEVALVEMENMQVICFVMERHPNGFVTVFVPSAPTPYAGSVFFTEADHVHVVDVDIKDALRCVSRLGAGSAIAKALSHEAARRVS